MNPRRAKPTVLFGALALITLALAVIFGLLLSAQLAKATADFKGLDKERKDLQKEVESKPLARLREDSRRIDAQLGEVETKLAERDYMPVFTERIEYVGHSTGVEFKELRPQEYRKGKTLGTSEGGAPVGKYGEYDITLRFSGSFAAVFKTIQELGGLPQMVCVNDLDLKSVMAAGQPAATSPKLDVVLDLTAFILEGGAFPGKFVAESH